MRHAHGRLSFALLVLAVVLAAVGLSGASGASAAPAARATAATSAATVSPPHEVGKVTLADTSIDGPALWSGPRGVPPYGTWAVLAWTGTDPAHHLNVMTSTDGIHYGNKRVLNETSFARPAVTVTDGRMVVAWTGTDAHHSLNILYDVYGARPKKLTLWDENSFAAPAIQPAGYLVLAWAGTDANHTLNTLRIDTAAGLKRDVKLTLPALYNSKVGPGLGSDHTGVQFTEELAPLLLTWAYRTPVNRMDALVSFYGVKWYTVPEMFAVAFPNQQQAHPPQPREWSDATPSIQAFVSASPGGRPTPLTVWAWRGIDPAHSVNVQIDTLSLNGSPQKVTLAETALGGPAVGEKPSSSATPGEFLVAWTGTDPAHHLNIARIGV